MNIIPRILTVEGHPIWTKEAMDILDAIMDEAVEKEKSIQKEEDNG